jgi:hypothetical protein
MPPPWAKALAPAKDQRFSTAGGHDLHPTGLLSAFVSVEIFERADVMHLKRLRQTGCPAMLTDLSQKSPFEF